MPPKERRPMSEIIAEKRRAGQQQQQQHPRQPTAAVSASPFDGCCGGASAVDGAAEHHEPDFDKLELDAWNSTAPDVRKDHVVVVGFDSVMTRGHISNEGRYPERPNRLSRTIQLLRDEKVMIAPDSNIRRFIDFAPVGATEEEGGGESSRSSDKVVPMTQGRLATEKELSHLLAGNETGAAIKKFLFSSRAAASQHHWDEAEMAKAAAANLPPASLLSTDLHVDPTSALCARRAAAVSIDAALGVASGRFRHAFCTVRPPGHHSGPDCCHGFCLVNNVGAAASALLLPHSGSSGSAAAAAPAKRVAIIDIDVHHGDGGQSVCDSLNKTLQQEQRAAGDENAAAAAPAAGEVLFLSMHRYDNGTFFPGTGHPSSFGPCGLNFNIGFNTSAGAAVAAAAAAKRQEEEDPAAEKKNAATAERPVQPSCDVICDYTLEHITRSFIVPLLRDAFQPDVILVSCGFDALEGDPLGAQAVSAEGLGQFFEDLASQANRPVCAVLEGGYEIPNVARGTLAAVRGLARAKPTGSAAAAAEWKHHHIPKKLGEKLRQWREKDVQWRKQQEDAGEEEKDADTIPHEEFCQKTIREQNVAWTRKTIRDLAELYRHAELDELATRGEGSRRVAEWFAKTKF